LRRNWLLLTLALLAECIYCVAFLQRYPLRRHVDIPLLDLGKISERRPEGAAVFAVALASLFLLYALAYLVVERHNRRPGGGHAPGPHPIIIVLPSLVFAATLLFVYPFGAGDVFDYIVHGHMVTRLGLNPLTEVGADYDIPFNAYSPYVAYEANYGPLWSLFEGGVNLVAGPSSLRANLLGFKLLAVGSYLTCGGLIYAILRRRAPERATAGLLLWLWNPLVVLESAANAHNDATMLAFALAGILAYELRHERLMIVALTCSAMIKIPLAILLPLFGLAALRARFRHRPAGRWPWTYPLSSGVIVVALVALLYLSQPEPGEALGNLSRRGDLFTNSPATVAVKLLALLTQMSAAAAKRLVALAVTLAFGTFYLNRLYRAWRDPDGILRHAYDACLLLLLFATTWLQPWYVQWLVALAALQPRPRAPGIAGWFSYGITWSYLVYGFAWFWWTRVMNWGQYLVIHSLSVALSLSPLAAYAFISRRAALRE
jgi:hypothetical protein